MEGSSHEQALWLDLQRLPERWDGTVAGDGPAARAVLSGKACWMSATDNGFLPWRRAAENEGVNAAGAWPFQAIGETWLLQIYADRMDWPDEKRRQQVEKLTAAIARLLDDDARLRELRRGPIP